MVYRRAWDLFTIIFPAYGRNLGAFGPVLDTESPLATESIDLDAFIARRNRDQIHCGAGAHQGGVNLAGEGFYQYRSHV